LIASLAKLARRGSRSRCRLLRRRSGTKSVSPRSSSARRRAIRLWLPRSPSSLCLMARCARGDVRRLAAVFVGSDETTVSETGSARDAFRRPLLQIGGANIAGPDRALGAAYFVVTPGRKTCPSLLLSTPERDPSLIASLAKLAVS